MRGQDAGMGALDERLQINNLSFFKSIDTWKKILKVEYVY